jgi:UPF0755 protein
MAGKKGKKKMSGRNRKLLIAFLLVLLVATGLTFWSFYRKVFAPNVVLKQATTQYIYIPTGSTFPDVMRILQDEGYLKNSESFRWVAEQMNYPSLIKPGRYQIKRKMNNRELIGLLRSGRQTPLRLTFSNIRTVEQLAGVVGNKIEADSASIAFLFRDEAFQKNYGFNAQSSLSIVIPNTYEFYWNTSAEEFYIRLAKEYKKFWTESRRTKASKIGLTQAEVSALASIVEQETRRNDEKPTIAGVYLNRYRKGWKLKADPTLVYALGDFTVRRVLNEYKEIDSPYNTYMYTGLPPGPICMPSVASIDAVLNYQEHNYLFFCARADFSGYHAFANTYAEHLVNARKFQKELNRRNIRS